MTSSQIEDTVGTLFQKIRIRAEAEGRGPKCWPAKSLFRREYISDEWIFFDIAIFDFMCACTFRAEDNSRKQAVRNCFGRHLDNWFGNDFAPHFPESRTWSFPHLPEPLLIPPEDAEPMLNRFDRRLSTYVEVINKHARGRWPVTQDLVVASFFCSLCGVSDRDFLDGVARYYRGIGQVIHGDLLILSARL
jgi:hypothetical protein